MIGQVGLILLEVSVNGRVPDPLHFGKKWNVSELFDSKIKPLL